MRYIPVGRVISTHGVGGEVKFRYYNDAKEGFLRYTTLFVEHGAERIELKSTGIRSQKGFFYIRFEGLKNPEEVFSLMDKELSVREEDLPQLDEDAYYDYQLIGLDVLNRKDEKIGKVERVFHTKANDIIVVMGKKEIFIPMVEGYIARIDLKGSFIKIDEEAFLV